MRFLAHEGIVGISVGYRRSTKKGLDGSVDDAARALAWVREHASEIGVDPSRVFAVGDSAGGHIVLALALGLGAAAKVNPPSAVVAGWPAVGTEPRHWLTYCADEFDKKRVRSGRTHLNGSVERHGGGQQRVFTSLASIGRRRKGPMQPSKACSPKSSCSTGSAPTDCCRLNMMRRGRRLYLL